MDLKPRLPAGRAKIFLGASVIFLLVFLISLKTKSTGSAPDLITLEAKENKFHVSFNFSKNGEDNFIQILEKLNLPQNTKEGFTFGLDSTTSARLAFASPIRANLDIKQDMVNFEGESTKNPTQNQFLVHNLRIPKTSNLMVAASNFKDFVKSKTTSVQLTDWLDENLNSQPQYLIIFNKNADFAIIFGNENIDYEDLKEVQVLGEPIYYNESNQDTDFHIIKIPEIEEQKPLTFTIFTKDGITFLVSSYEAAQELLNIQKGNGEAIEFPNLRNDQNISLAILYLNSNESPAEDNFFKLLFDTKPQFENLLKKISRLEFTLKSNRFSGLISIQ